MSMLQFMGIFHLGNKYIYFDIITLLLSSTGEIFHTDKNIITIKLYIFYGFIYNTRICFSLGHISRFKLINVNECLYYKVAL